MPPHSEVSQDEILKASIEQLAESVQAQLITDHGLDRSEIPNIKNALLAGYSPEQVIDTVAGIGIEIEGGLGDADTFTLPHESSAPQIEQVVWLDTQNPDIAGLAELTDANFEQHMQGILMVTEEISHFVYIYNYFRHYQQEPPHWAQEMIAALDKYVTIQKRFIAKYGQPMNPQQQQFVFQDIFRAAGNPNAPEEHQIGQFYARHIISQLDSMVKQAKKTEADQLESYIYQADEQTLREVFESRSRS